MLFLFVFSVYFVNKFTFLLHQSNKGILSNTLFVFSWYNIGSWMKWSHYSDNMLRSAEKLILSCNNPH